MWQGIQSDPSSNDSDEYMSASSNDSDEYMSASSNQMPQEISSDPSNHSDEFERIDLSNPMPQEILSDQSVPDLRFASNYRDYFNIGLPLYEASIKCDWKAAEAILNKNSDKNLLRCKITENGETALHIAASAKAPSKKVEVFVQNLVDRMENQEDLELLNNNKSTALYLAAAAGNVKTVEIMMNRHRFLDRIPGGGGDMMPLDAAVLFGNKDVARYLYECSEGLRYDGWTRQRRASLLEKCVESDMFDIAVDIVNKDPELGASFNFLNANLLGLLARKPEALHENKSSNPESNIIRRTIKSGVSCTPSPIKRACSNVVRFARNVSVTCVSSTPSPIKRAYNSVVRFARYVSVTGVSCTPSPIKRACSNVVRFARNVSVTCVSCTPSPIKRACSNVVRFARNVSVTCVSSTPSPIKRAYNSVVRFARYVSVTVSTFIGLKAGTPVKEGDALSLLRILWEDIVKHENKWNMDYLLRGPPTYSIGSDLALIAQNIQLKQLIFENFDQLEVETKRIMVEGTQKVSRLKELVDRYAVKMHVETQRLIKKENITKEDQALELQKLISEYIVKLHSETETMAGSYCLPEYEEDIAQTLLGLISDHIEQMRAETKIRANTYSYSVMFIAAEVGNTNFLIELIRRSPDLIWKVNDNKQTIFHVAIKHRHQGIYNLIYEIGSMKDMVTLLVDKDGNNMLHLAAMSTRKKNLENVIGAALQMQRELLWFKEVERMIPPYLRESKNKDGLTPRELFTNEHQDLINQGEKWMKQTASQCMVVATLIATIVFAAAFTVPGGYNQNNGTPMFEGKLTFVTFVIADAISLTLSSASILIFFSFSTSRYAELDFVASSPMKLMLGLVTLFLSIGAMMVTFSVSFFVLYHKEMKWIPIFISLFAVIPAILYVALQFHLLVDIVRSTYDDKYLFKPTRQVLFYENPRF